MIQAHALVGLFLAKRGYDAVCCSFTVFFNVMQCVCANEELFLISSVFIEPWL